MKNYSLYHKYVEMHRNNCNSLPSPPFYNWYRKDRFIEQVGPNWKQLLLQFFHSVTIYSFNIIAPPPEPTTTHQFQIWRAIMPMW